MLAPKMYILENVNHHIKNIWYSNMNKEKAIEKIQYAKMQVASVYACSAIFDEKTNVIEGRQKELEKAIVNFDDALKELEDE